MAMFVFLEVTHLSVILERVTGTSTFTMPFAGGERKTGEELGLARMLLNSFKRFYYPDKDQRVDWFLSGPEGDNTGRDHVVELFRNAIATDISKLGFDVDPSALIVNVGGNIHAIKLQVRA